MERAKLSGALRAGGGTVGELLIRVRDELIKVEPHRDLSLIDVRQAAPDSMGDLAATESTFAFQPKLPLTSFGALQMERIEDHPTATRKPLGLHLWDDAEFSGRFELAVPLWPAGTEAWMARRFVQILGDLARRE